MEHADFVRQWNTKTIEIDVDRSKALQVANSKLLPGRYRNAHIFWSTIWLLSIPGAFALMYFYTWWAGVLALIFVTPALSKSTKTSAQQFMIDYALESPDFYKLAIEKEIIRVRPKA